MKTKFIEGQEVVCSLYIPQDTKVWVWNINENPDERKRGAYFSHFSKEGRKTCSLWRWPNLLDSGLHYGIRLL